MSMKTSPTLWSTTKSDWVGFPVASEDDFVDALENITEFPNPMSDQDAIEARLAAYDTQVTESALQQIVK